MGKHRNITCVDCFLSMRSDNLKRHQASCRKVRRVFADSISCAFCCKQISTANFARHSSTCRAPRRRPRCAQLFYAQILQNCSSRVHPQLSNFLQHIQAVAEAAEYRDSRFQKEFIQKLARICARVDNSPPVHIFDSSASHFDRIRVGQALMHLSFTQSADLYSLLGLPAAFQWRVIYSDGLLHTHTTLEILHFYNASPDTRYLFFLNLQCASCSTTPGCKHSFDGRLEDLCRGVLRTTSPDISDFHFPSPLYVFLLVPPRIALGSIDIARALVVQEDSRLLPLLPGS